MKPYCWLLSVVFDEDVPEVSDDWRPVLSVSVCEELRTLKWSKPLPYGLFICASRSGGRDRNGDPASLPYDGGFETISTSESFVHQDL